MENQNPSTFFRARGVSSILIILIIVGALVVGGGLYWWLTGGKFTKAGMCYKNLNNLGRSGIPSMPDPAVVFCECMGGKSTIEKTDSGEKGLCQIEGRAYGDWDYFCEKNKDDNVYADCRSYQSKSQDETADWKTYRNDSFGFEFKYPAVGKIETSQSGMRNIITLRDLEKGYTGNDFIVLTVAYSPNQAGITIDEWWVEAGKDSSYKKTGETTIAFRKALILEIENSEAGPRYVFTSKERAGFIFDISTVALSKEAINQILSTFKFTPLESPTP